MIYFRRFKQEMHMSELITIGEAAKTLGVTTTTLRRWDKSGKLRPIRISDTGHRYYKKRDIELILSDLPSLSKNWAASQSDASPAKEYHCQNSATFASKLTKMGDRLAQIQELKEIHPLIVAATGEIGNNSFDHNIGNWPDVPGIFFAYDLQKRIIVLADRGKGILSTLKRVRPSLESHEDALYVAFTERITGREPESRGNGLKFVKKVASEYPLNLEFYTGDAKLEIETGDTDIQVTSSDQFFQGCVATIKF